MSLPTLLKTWQFNVNQPIGGLSFAIFDNAFLLYSIKESLIGFANSAWFVAGSSDGSVGAMDAIDRWTSSGDIGWDTPADPHGWIVLQQEGIHEGMQMLISCGVTSVSNGSNIRIGFSPSAGFTGGDESADPTATDVFFHNSATPVDRKWSCDAVSDGHLHVIMSDDGQSTRIITRNNSGASHTVTTCILIDVPVGPPAGWTVPLAVVVNGANLGGTDASAIGSILAASEVISSRGNAAFFKMFFTEEGYATSSGLGASVTIANEFDSNWPMFPLGMVSLNVAGTRGRNGYWADLYGGSTGQTTGTTYPSGSSKQFLQLGNLIIPWNGSTPLL